MAEDEVEEGGTGSGNTVVVGDVQGTGEVNIAGGDIHKGYTPEQVSVLIRAISATFQPKPFDGRPPYKGLDYFEEEDADLFFGRERLVDGLVRRIKGSRTLFVTGPSGSGKSSLVRAGLIHALKQGCIKDSERWLYGVMKPGREPIAELARLAAKLARSTNAEDEICSRAAADPTIFRRWCEIALGDGKEERAVVFIDQFEEVFTQISKESASTFIEVLDEAVSARDSRIILVLAMRSDFISNCALYPKLNALYNRQNIQIGGMQPEELVSAIAQPALRVGLRIDPELIAQIIDDMQGEPGALPLMQFALKDLFDAQQAQGGLIALTLRDYLQRGGIRKALERHADESFNKLDSHEQELARTIFTGLIEIRRGTQDTRRTALFDELVPAGTKSEEVKAIVRKLADARLVTTDEVAGRDTVTISHEKLIEAWPWLKRLVEENREVIALQNEIATDAKEWEEHKRDASYLYAGARLANVNEQLKANRLVLSGTALEYIHAGQARRRREQRTRVLGLTGIVVLIVSGILLFSMASSTQSRNFANTQVVIARTSQANAVKAREASTLAVSNEQKAQEQANLAMARQFAAQAQSIIASRNSKQMHAVLLAIQSLKMFQVSEGAQILLNSNLAGHPVARLIHVGQVNSLAFSTDGVYVASGSSDGTARVWEAATGQELARMAHEDGVNSVAFSRDGKYVVSGSEDGTARVWEATTGQEIARMTNDDGVNSVAFSRDGKYVVSGSGDGTARVWEAATGQELARMAHDDGVNSVAFSRDGKYVVSGSRDSTARVWEVTTGQELARMIHDGPVFSVAFSRDGKYVVSGGRDSTARVWDAATGREIARMTHVHWVYSVAFSPDDKTVASGSYDGTARMWEAMTGQELARLTHDDMVRSVAFSPDGKTLVSGSYDGTARVWEAATGQELARMTHNGPVFSVAFGPDGKTLASGSGDGTAWVWEAATSKELARMTHNGPVFSVAFSREGKRVVSGSRDSTTRVWDATTGQEIARMAHDSLVNSVAFSPDGMYVVSGSEDNTARVWEAATGRELARMTHNNWVNSVAFSPDSRHVVSGSEDNTARVWEATTGQELARMIHDNPVSSVAFSPDGKYVVSGSIDDTARVWDAATGQELARMTHDGMVSSVAFSPDGKYVVSGSFDGTTRVWDATTGQEIARMTHSSQVNSLAFSTDGKYVAWGSSDGTVQIWEAATGQELARMTHDDWVNSVAFSPDGKYVVSGSEDNTARVWEAATGREIARMTHDGTVYSLAFSPDGRYVVSGSGDDTARVWYWQHQDLMNRACDYLPRNLTRAEWQQYIGDALPYPAKQEEAPCPNLPIEP